MSSDDSTNTIVSQLAGVKLNEPEAEPRTLPSRELLEVTEEEARAHPGMVKVRTRDIFFDMSGTSSFPRLDSDGWGSTDDGVGCWRVYDDEYIDEWISEGWYYNLGRAEWQGFDSEVVNTL
ncbi:hypothetical protein D9613_008981 [Agrocybe pediades]|uniref:Uncharacterized protein n=1 Tax=Agrocybe pediades TaxID=84607 RepID=A0A8H4VTM2_9AGAR|nr:hypothetical protein D9613_008981 [Agrocybe pediades]